MKKRIISIFMLMLFVGFSDAVHAQSGKSDKSNKGVSKRELERKRITGLMLQRIKKGMDYTEYFKVLNRYVIKGCESDVRRYTAVYQKYEKKLSKTKSRKTASQIKKLLSACNSLKDAAAEFVKLVKDGDFGSADEVVDKYLKAEKAVKASGYRVKRDWYFPKEIFASVKSEDETEEESEEDLKDKSKPSKKSRKK